MSEIIISLSSNSVDKAIDEYHDTTSYTGSSSGSSSNSNSSSGGNTTDEQYMSGVLGIPLEVFRNNLGRGQHQGLGLVPRQVFLHPLL